MTVKFWVRDERLEDVIADVDLLHISEIGPMRDEICVSIKTLEGAIAILGTLLFKFFVPRSCKITVEEILENLCAEAALKLGVVRSKNTIRLGITSETKDRVDSRVDEFIRSMARFLADGMRAKNAWLAEAARLAKDARLTLAKSAHLAKGTLAKGALAKDAPRVGMYWLTAFRYRICRPFVPDCIEDLIGGYFEMSLSDLEPKTIVGE